MKLETIPFAKVKSAAYNPRADLTPQDAEWQQIEDSYKRYGQVRNFVLNERTGNVVSGHQGIKIMQNLGHNEGNFHVIDVSEDDEKRLNIILNTPGGKWDAPKLESILREMQANNVDIETLGFSRQEIDDIIQDLQFPAPPTISLADKFLVAPFSVLSAREGWWQDRKRQWIAIGIQSELGRGEGSEPGGSKMPAVNKKTGKLARGDSHCRLIEGTDAQ